jgi:hypothetical protein
LLSAPQRCGKFAVHIQYWVTGRKRVGHKRGDCFSRDGPLEYPSGGAHSGSSKKAFLYQDLDLVKKYLLVILPKKDPATELLGTRSEDPGTHLSDRASVSTAPLSTVTSNPVPGNAVVEVRSGYLIPLNQQSYRSISDRCAGMMRDGCGIQLRVMARSARWHVLLPIARYCRARSLIVDVVRLVINITKQLDDEADDSRIPDVVVVAHD